MKLDKTDWLLVGFLIVYAILWIVFLPFQTLELPTYPRNSRFYIEWINLGILIVIGIIGIATYLYLKMKK